MSPGRPSDPPLEEIRRERDEFLKSFFQKGAKLAEELVKEQEQAASRIASLEAENAMLRAQVASNDAIRDMLKKVEDLERENREMMDRYRTAEAERTENAAVAGEIEAELSNLANLYVASFQLHSSLSPRAVMKHVKELLGQLVGAEAFCIYMRDDAGKTLVPVAFEGVSESDVGPVTLGEGKVGEAALSGVAIEGGGDTRSGSVLDPIVSFPLLFDDRVVGAVSIFRTLEQKSEWSRVDRELMKLLGAQAVHAIVSARAYVDTGKKFPPLSAFVDLGV